MLPTLRIFQGNTGVSPRDQGITIALVLTDTKNPEISDADAALIAAAPELLEACQASLKAFRAIYDILENEENCNPDELIEVLLDEEDYWPLSQIRTAIEKAESK